MMVIECDICGFKNTINGRFCNGCGVDLLELKYSNSEENETTGSKTSEHIGLVDILKTKDSPKDLRYIGSMFRLCNKPTTRSRISIQIKSISVF